MNIPLSSNDPTSLPGTATTLSSGSLPGSGVIVSQQAAGQQTVDNNAVLIAQYEGRIRNLMSDKDKAINDRNQAIDERNQAITQFTELQRTYGTLQEQTQSSLTSSANATQQAIDRAKDLEKRVQVLQGETSRAQVLLEKPHLAPYAQFIPASADPNEVKAAVEQLEQIRNQDLERNRLLLQGGAPAAQTAFTSSTATPVTAQQVANLYAGRQNMNLATAILPGSTPAQMNPAAMTDPVVSIQQLFDDAKRSGKPEDFERAIQQASLLSQSAVAAQFGRS